MTNQTTEAPMPIALPEELDASALDTAPVDGSGVNWADEAGMQGDNSSEDIVAAVEGENEILEESEEGAPAEATPVVTPTVSEDPAPVIAPVAETPPTPAPAPTPLPVPEPFDLAKWETEQLSGLEKLYAITEDDAGRLQTEPELVLPKLAANMHMAMTKSLLTAVQAMIPDYVVQHNAVATADQEAKQAFYSANKDLVNHEAAVMQVAKIFRAANPTAPREVAIKTIGDMVRMSLGITPQATTPPPAQTLQQVVNPSAARPFTPAKGGGQRAPAKAPNQWDDLIKDDF